MPTKHIIANVEEHGYSERMTKWCCQCYELEIWDFGFDCACVHVCVRKQDLLFLTSLLHKLEQ